MEVFKVFAELLKLLQNAGNTYLDIMVQVRLEDPLGALRCTLGGGAAWQWSPLPLITTWLQAPPLLVLTVP